MKSEAGGVAGDRPVVDEGVDRDEAGADHDAEESAAGEEKPLAPAHCATTLLLGTASATAGVATTICLISGSLESASSLLRRLALIIA